MNESQVRRPRRWITAVAAVTVMAASGGVAYAQGDAAADKNPGRVSAMAPGDASVYVPLAPCRVVDTRIGGGGVFRPGQTRSYRVWGSGPQFAAQGGRSGGCGVDADSIAVEATVTAVGPSGAGFLRTWATGFPEPNATFLNYSRGINISNTGALTVSDTFTNDLTVKNYGANTHYVIDVVGFYANISG